MNAIKSPYLKLASDLGKTERLLEIVASLFPTLKVAGKIARLERQRPTRLKKVAYLSKGAYEKFHSRVASEGDSEEQDDPIWTSMRLDAEGFEYLFRQAYLREILTRKISAKNKDALRNRAKGQLKELQAELTSINLTLQGKPAPLSEVAFFSNRFSREPEIISLDPNKAQRDEAYREKLSRVADIKTALYEEKKKKTKVNPLLLRQQGSSRSTITRALEHHWWRDSSFRALVIENLGTVPATKLLENPMKASRSTRSAGKAVVSTLMRLSKDHPEPVMEKARDVLLGASTNQLVDAEGNVVGEDIKPDKKSLVGIAKYIANHASVTFGDVANEDTATV